MSVIRVNHQENYVVIKNDTVLIDPTLSWKAKGIWAYCMSRPNDWQFHVSHLITVSQDSRDSVRAGLKELETAGYLTRLQSREDGRFGKFDYEISETKISLPQTDFPATVKAGPENQPLVSIDNQLNIEELTNQPFLPKEKAYGSKLVGSSDEEKKAMRKVLLGMEMIDQHSPEKEKFTPEEVDKLLEDFSVERIRAAGRYVRDKKPVSQKGYFINAIYKGYK